MNNVNVVGNYVETYEQTVLINNIEYMLCKIKVRHMQFKVAIPTDKVPKEQCNVNTTCRVLTYRDNKSKLQTILICDEVEEIKEPCLLNYENSATISGKIIKAIVTKNNKFIGILYTDDDNLVHFISKVPIVVETLSGLKGSEVSLQGYLVRRDFGTYEMIVKEVTKDVNTCSSSLYRR